MGTDYGARKQAKRRRKGADVEATNKAEVEGRRRNKRNKARRLCQVSIARFLWLVLHYFSWALLGD